jgi:hypothetical protein
MADRILKLRELNRATLARQMLLERESLSVTAAIERLVGLQAQLASAPYVGLWTRLRDFRREDLAREIDNRKVVKATMMRATLHLCTADDYLRFRTALKPVLIVQVPINIGWSYSNKPEFTLAESWIGRPISPEDNLRELVFRYLAAFGPASVTDAQTWMGMKLKETFEKLRPELQTYRGEGRTELFDLPGVELLAEDVPAPVRFLPEYDNLLLSHSNRSRVIADEYRSKVYLPGLRVAATILVDGFVRGAWKIEKTKTAATLVIEPFDKLTKKDRAALTEEGERLVRFVEPKAKSFDARFTA